MAKNQSSKNFGGVAAAAREISLPIIEGLGYKLWDIEYVKEGAEWCLRVTIDSDAEGDVGIEDCSVVCRALDEAIESADIIKNKGNFTIEVSSPGIERDIRLPEHIIYCLGSEVEARLYAAINGKKVIRGTLAEFDGEEDVVTMRVDPDGDIRLPRRSIVKMKTIFNFDKFS